MAYSGVHDRIQVKINTQHCNSDPQQVELSIMYKIRPGFKRTWSLSRNRYSWMFWFVVFYFLTNFYHLLRRKKNELLADFSSLSIILLRFIASQQSTSLVLYKLLVSFLMGRF